MDSVKQFFSTLRLSILRFDFKALYRVENILVNLPFIAFLFLMVMVYIRIIHSVENTVRSTDRLKREVKEIRWGYMTGKAELMFQSKQTEVAKAVEEIGLEQLKEPPKKVVVKDER